MTAGAGAAPPDRPRDGTRLFLLDGDGVLFSEEANELCSLSPLGVAVWQGLEAGQTAEAIARSVADLFQVALTDAAALVKSTLDLLREHGLFAGSPLPARPAPAPRRPTDSRIPPYASGAVAAERHYRLLGSTFAVRCSAREEERWVHPVFAHLETTDRSVADVVIDVVAGDGSHFVYEDAAPARLVPTIDRLAPVVKEVLWNAAVNRHAFFLYLHAGVVGDGGRCVLLPAASGSGKSSLTAALCRHGFDYFSDEVALLEPRTFRVRPVPLSLCAKDTGWKLLSPYYPEIWTLAVHRRADGKVVRYVPPPRSKLVEPERDYPVSHIVFPRYEPDATTAIQPIARIDALRRLMDECLAIRVRFDVENVGGVVEWISRVETYELPMSSLDRAAALVRDLVHGQ